ncbi:MAG: hypothetical protein R3C49_27825 [Planctomycetaceae bacterium]
MAKTNPETAAPTIEQLTQQYHTLNERKIQAQTQLQEAQKRLEELQRQAEKDFGTSDITALQNRLKQMETENEKRRSDYQQLLAGIQADLQKIESGKPAATGEAE